MAAGEIEAYNEFAGLFGPVLRAFLVGNGIGDSSSEALVASALVSVGAKLANTRDPSAWIWSIEDTLVGRLWRDLQLAAEDQRRTFQGLSELSAHGVEVAAINRAARIVSGDFFDVHVTDGGILLAVGDASGQGVAAALYASHVMGIMHALVASRETRDPQPLLTEINEALIGSRRTNRYVCLTVGLLNPVRRTVMLAAAGGPRPLVRIGGTWQEVGVGGMPLGLIEHRQPFEESMIQLGSGDFLLLASDGILEQEDARGESYGTGRLFDLLSGKDDWTVNGLVENILADIDRFAVRAGQTDDQAIIAVRLTE